MILVQTYNLFLEKFIKIISQMLPEIKPFIFIWQYLHDMSSKLIRYFHFISMLS